MNKNKLEIMDFLVHQSAQANLCRVPHNFYMAGPDAKAPKWNINHIPLPENLKLVSENDVFRKKFDVIIVRSPINMNRYMPYIYNGAIPIAVVQTTTAFNMPKEVRHVVWNSLTVMNQHKSRFPKCKHFHIVHGFDPNEFKQINLEENNRILTVANVFKGRSHIMGYPLWQQINQNFKKCDILGHGNEDIPESIGRANSFDELINYYNKYSVCLNPTIESAMPRSRGEAAMCGMPIVSTKNFDIDFYFKHNANAILSNDKNELIIGLKKLLDSSEMRKNYGEAAKEIATKHFHIDDYVAKWQNILKSL